MEVHAVSQGFTVMTTTSRGKKFMGQHQCTTFPSELPSSTFAFSAGYSSPPGTPSSSCGTSRISSLDQLQNLLSH